MPRLIQRLAKFLQEDAAGKIIYRQRQRQPKSNTTIPKRRQNHVAPKRPAFISPLSRKRSLLLDVNPIMNPKRYMPPRELKPVLASKQSTKFRVSRRSMNETELNIMASPYARMLSSPIRTCTLTKGMQPRDLLVCLGAALDPTTHQKYILPNRIEHPKYRPRAEGKGYWICCWRKAVEELTANAPKSGMPGGAIPHRLLAQQIEELLHIRLVQELELLRDSLKTSRNRLATPDSTLIRRLTRREWMEVRSNKQIKLPGTAAILVLPQIPNPSNLKATLEASGSSKLKPTFQMISDTSSDSFSPRKIPLYNLAGMFSDVSLRTQVKKTLSELLKLEYSARSRWLSQSQSQNGTKTERSRDPLDEASNAYILRSTAATLSRADSVPTCIALWRLRLWAGEGWSDSLWGKWEVSEDS